MNTNVLNDSAKNLDIEKLPPEDRKIGHGICGIVTLVSIGIIGICYVLKQ